MRGGRHNITHFSGFYVREGKREKKTIQVFFRRSTKFRRSEFVGPRSKVHRLDKGYACVPKMRDFIKNPKEEI